MMQFIKCLSYTFLIGLSLCACSQEAPVRELDLPPELDGTYTGTFERAGEVSMVSLTFTNNEFNGESDRNRFPAIGAGTFLYDNDTKISFSNATVWPANFDWTLILNEDWNIEKAGLELTLTNSLGDIYRLTGE